MDEDERDDNRSKGLIESIREVNAKYRTPRIKMTPMVNISLWVLRIYLFAVLIILAYKFATMVIH